MSYVITSLNNDRVKHVRRLQADRRYRAREGAFVVEGARWLADALQQQVTPLALFCTGEWREQAGHAEILHQVDTAVQAVSDEVMAAMSDTETPSGVLAVLPMRPQPIPDYPELLLILDQIRDPGNLGTMLRTAAAAGADGVLLSRGCVDPYNPKAVRAGMGAHLRLPVHQLEWPEIADVSRGVQVWLATAGGALPYTGVNWRQPSALIVGSEAHGAGGEAASLAAGTIYIPMYAATESLNAAVAAGVILFEAARQRQ